MALPQCVVGVHGRHGTIVTWPLVNDGDLGIRNLTHRLFVDRGQAPTSAAVAAAAGADASEVRAVWARLHDAHAIVLDAQTGELVMAQPFCAVATRFRVHTGERWWYANCAWDAFGICAAVHLDGRVETSCADCGEPITCAGCGERPYDESLLFHCLVPAAGWWDDIVFT